MQTLIENEINQIQQENKESFVVNSNEDLIRINAVLRGVKALKKKVTDELDPEIKKANDAHKGLTALRKKHLLPLEEIEDKINSAIKFFTIKQEQEAILLQKKINKDLADKAEAEKKRILEESKQSDEWGAEILKEQASQIVAQTVSKEECIKSVAPKQEGQYKRSNWKARITNEELIPRIWLMPNMQLLEKRAKELKVQGMTIPGVEFYDDFTMVTKE